MKTWLMPPWDKVFQRNLVHQTQIRVVIFITILENMPELGRPIVRACLAGIFAPEGSKSDFFEQRPVETKKGHNLRHQNYIEL